MTGHGRRGRGPVRGPARQIIPALFDELIGDGFANITRRQGTGAYDAETRQFFDALDTRVPYLDDAAAATDIDGLLTTLLDDVGVDALLLRPDRVVVASADRPGLRGWRRSLEQAGVTAARAAVTNLAKPDGACLHVCSVQRVAQIVSAPSVRVGSSPSSLARTQAGRSW